MRANVIWSEPVAEDNCGVQSVTRTQGPAPGTFLSVGTTTIEYLVLDVNGNTATCSFDITVEDDELPELSCPVQFLTQSANASCEWVVPGDLIDATATDNCGVTSLTNDYNNDNTLAGEIFPLGTTTVTWTAEDAAGNSVSCSYVVIVIDDGAPVVTTCPSDITVENDEDECGAVVEYPLPTFEDNCDGTGLTGTLTEGLASGELFPVGTTVVTYEYTDAAGNGPAVCSFTVTVNDTQAPEIECPNPVVVTTEGEVLEGGDCTALGFTGCFEPANWTITVDGDGSVDVSGAPDEVTLVSNDAGGSFSQTLLCITMPADGELSFDWDYETFDVDGPSFDPFGYSIDGVFTQLTDDFGADQQSGSVTITLSEGQEFCFDQQASDGILGAGVTISSMFAFLDANPSSLEVIGTGPCGVTLSYDAPVGTDNCPGAITLLTSGLGEGPNYYQYGGTYTEAYQVIDAAGNTAECSFTIIVEDPEPPVISCPVDFTVNNDPGLCGAVVNYSFPLDGDNCPGWTVELTEGLEPGSVFPLGTTLVEYTITDDAGNTNFCSFNVTVEDTEAPEITECPADRDVTADTDCMGTVPDLTGEVVAEDNCTASADLTITQSPAAGTLFGGAHGDTQVVTITVTDEFGNATTCEVVLTLVDETDPTIDCTVVDGNVVAEAGLCSFTQTTDAFDPDFDDNCAATISHNYIVAPNNNTLAGATFPVGTTTVTWTATDENGNTASCDITIVVADEEDPVFVNCPEDLTVNNDPDKCGSNVIWSVPVAEDNCGVASVEQTEGLAPGSFLPVGTTTIEYEVTDVNGNTATCSFDIEVMDMQLPEISCPTQFLTQSANASCEWVVPGDLIDATATDNCGVTSLTNDYNNDNTLAGEIFPLGTTTVTWTAEDAAGNSITCSYVVVVIDDSAPVVSTCPSDITVENDEDECGAVVEYPLPTFEDNCDGTGLTGTLTEGLASGELFPVGTTVVTYEYTDAAGNGPAVCSFTVTVNDTQAPEIECFNDIIVTTQGTVIEGGGVCDAIGFEGCFAPANWTVSVDGDGQVDVSNAPNSVTLVGSDDGTINAQSLLCITVPADGTMEFDWDYVTSDVDGPLFDPFGYTIDGVYTQLTDDDGPIAQSGSVSISLVAGQVFCFRQFATDGVLGSATTISNMFVFEDESVNVEVISTGPCGVTLSYEAPVGTDNCPGAITLLTSGQGEGPNYYQYGGTYTEAYQVIDAAGNTAECSFTITVEDSEDPVVTCPVDFTVNNDPGVCGAVVNYSYPLNGDNCPGWTVELTQGLEPGSVFPVGTTLVEFTITDDAGNEMTCSFEVTVEDTEAPEITECPADRDVTADTDCMGTVPDLIGEVVAEDNCTASADLTITQSPAAGTLFGGAHGDTQVVTITVTDEFGNATTCEVVLTLVDETDPTIDCTVVDGNVVADAGLCSFTQTTDAFDPDFDDNCAATISHNYIFAPNTNTLAGATFPVGTTTVTWTATDENGNTASCDITIVVADEEDPVFVNCPTEMIMIGNDPDQCSGKLNWSIPVATDNCGIESVEQTMGPAVGSEVPVCELLTIEYTATDVNGNSSTCSFEILVIDTQEPQFDADIVMPGDMTVECDAVPEPFVLTNDDVNDNCTLPEDLVIEFIEESTQGDDPSQCDFYTYTLTRTWTVTDEECEFGGGGNVLTHVQIIEVEDTTPPDAVCMDITLVLDKFGEATITGADIDGGSTDNCAAPEFLTFEADPNTFTCADLGPNEVTLTVTDPCGNASTCTAIVTVVEGDGLCVPEYDYANSIRNECLDNATTLQNGQFYELIQVHALAGQEWFVQTVNGLYQVGSPAPPAAPINILPGTPLTNGMSDGIDNDGDGEVDENDEMALYYLEGIHVDCQGYSVTLINNLGQTLEVSNKGCYPTPTTNLDGPYCLNTEPFEILVTDLFGAEGEAIEILVNGQPTNIFDAAALGEGVHEVKVTFDAGEAASYLIVNGEVIEGSDDGTQEDSGCQQMLTVFVQVVGTPTQVNCNDLIQVSIGPDCITEINPDMVLEGTYLCFDDYFVDIDYPFGTTQFDPSNQVDETHAGMTLTYTLNHINSGNMCWGEILVEDKLAPVTECPEDLEILCVQDATDLELTGEPVVTDCSETTTTYADFIEQFSCLENNDIRERITRTWITTDEWGNGDTCQQVIEVLRIDYEDIAWPGELFIGCDEVANGADPSITGYPQVNGVNLIPGETNDCGIGLSYSDHIVPTCEGSYIIERSWKLIDQCTPSGTQSYTEIQYINVEDVAPVIELSTATYDPVNDWYVLSANGESNDGSCAAFGPVPLATVTDACNEVESVVVITPVGTTTPGGLLEEPGLPWGEHQITYFAEDECGNVSELTVTVFVTDDIAPVPICDEITDVNLSSDGLAIVEAGVFDDGSYDNCCLDYFEVARMDGDCEGNPDDFGPTVTFCCTDVDAPVMVVFRAVDCFGNFNDCMVSVNVNDKQPPILLSCPASTTITCDDYLENYAAGVEQGDFSVLDGFGSPSFDDNCELIVDAEVTVNIDNCNEGPIVRSWTATDGSGNGPVNCSQTIFVQHVSDWVVEFPADVEGECVDGQLPDLGEPEIFFDECELIAISFEDVYFYVVPDACYKIERHWSVINWCVFDEFGEDVYAEISEQDLPGFQDWDGDGDDDARTFKDGVNDGPGPDGYISYVQIIKVVDEDDPDFTIPTIDGCIVDTDCDTDIILPMPDISDSCSPEFDVDISGDLGTYNDVTAAVTVADVEVGTYSITYAVTDNCGNTAYQTIELEVEDCKKPTPYCQDLIIEIMQTGMVDVWAEDFDAGSFDNCGPVDPSFSATDPDADGLTFTCDDLGEQEIEVYYHDIYGNVDFCVVTLDVQDNMGHCSGNAVPLEVAGAITTEQGDGVEDVMVEVNGGTYTDITLANGDYSFELPAGGDYSVSPMLDQDPTNGVTTFDLVLIMRHILNVELLDSPYKRIAADANNSGSISTLDMVDIRKVILFMEPNFPNNTSWRFVDSDYIFPDPQNPWTSIFPEVINYNNLAVEDLNADFIGVKIGDVNGTVQANATMEALDRTFNGTFAMEVRDMEITKGQTQTIEFRAPAAGISGYQFTLAMEGLELVDIVPGIASAENFGTAFLEEGNLTASWNDANAVRFNGGELLFGLTVRATQDVRLSEVLSVTSRYTLAEAYNVMGELLDVDLMIDGQPTANAFKLYQNVPNPFTRDTRIGFHLPEAAHATLTIMDGTGKVLHVLQGEYPAGYQEVTLRDLEVAPGILYYRLDTPTHSATRKMVLLN